MHKAILALSLPPNCLASVTAVWAQMASSHLHLSLSLILYHTLSPFSPRIFPRLTVSPGSRAVLALGASSSFEAKHAVPARPSSSWATTGRKRKPHTWPGLQVPASFLSGFAPWQDLWTDANPPGQFKITHTSLCEEVNTICQNTTQETSESSRSWGLCRQSMGDQPVMPSALGWCRASSCAMLC